MFGDLTTHPGGMKASPPLKNPNSTFKPLNFKHPQRNFIQIEFILILDVWWFNNPAPVEWRGPPRLKTPIPPSNP
jgi:hypothetical protein